MKNCVQLTLVLILSCYSQLDAHKHRRWGSAVDAYYRKSTVVCRSDSSDGCRCSESDGTIDCREDQRSTQHHLTSAAIRMENKTFNPQHVLLSGNDITEFKYKELLRDQEAQIETIDLSYNRINFVHDSAFDRFESLKKLVLSHNHLSINDYDNDWLTSELGNSLQHLQLDHNRLSSLPNRVFDCLENLDTLILDENPQLTLTNQTFGRGLRKLKTLSLNQCELTDLPAELFLELRNLRSLSLIGNPFVSIPVAINSAVTLKSLDLSKTEIPELLPNGFRNLTELQTLSLREMSFLYAIDDCAFCGLLSLISIDLSLSSKLHIINENAFGIAKDNHQALNNVRDARFESCLLKTFSPRLLNWKQLRVAAIGGNPLVCDEKLNWLVEDNSIPIFTQTLSPTCAEPKSKAGKYVRKKTTKETLPIYIAVGFVVFSFLLCLSFVFCKICCSPYTRV
ncbi:hypothetical protein M3Y95_00852900 [Aphelenchoides besseyi]|nr:hypothetical protein M3Y95_00852900 [Aphelenchoides besseyi]